MIFVGQGSLLRRAVVHAAGAGHRIDLVCSPDPADAAADGPPLRYLTTPDVNAHVRDLATTCTDGIVWSVNNRQIFREPVLSSGLRIVNVHNGLLPQHRGLPSAAIVFALLHGDREYGATVHEVDVGIDTGEVLAEYRFPLGPEDRFHQVMLRGVRACEALFERALPLVAAGSTAPVRRPPGTSSPGAYYGRAALDRLAEHAGHPAFARATDLGAFNAHAPELAAALRRVRAVTNGGGAGLPLH
ncbi:formyltransferase family protein [Streptomyces vinaceus]|uniref:formyltransferase family protein n=1 Tax=Streptomyces vinaceus TaxID=1960 RepID=UPI00381211C4